MQKAKSRIKTTPQTKPDSRRVYSVPKISKKYFKHLPLFFLSWPFYGSVYYIFSHIQPEKIRNFLIPNTYLPLQLVFFLGNFFLFSYLLLKTRRGLEISLWLSLLLFLKLQLIVNYLQPMLIVLVIMVLIEAIISRSD